jgi:hypothetical protein
MATQSCQVCYYIKPEPNAQSTINLINIKNLLTTTPFHFMVTIERNMWNESGEREEEKQSLWSNLSKRKASHFDGSNSKIQCTSSIEIGRNHPATMTKIRKQVFLVTQRDSDHN